jgi:hypothetical protein
MPGFFAMVADRCRTFATRRRFDGARNLSTARSRTTRSRDDAAILARMPQHGLDIRRSSPILETENTVAYYLRTNVHGIAA